MASDGESGEKPSSRKCIYDNHTYENWIRRSRVGREDRIVIALPDDTMGYMFARLRQAGYRGVVALAQDGPVKLAVIGPASPAQVTAAHELDDVVVINDYSTVGMFFEYLTHMRMMIVRASLAARMIDGEIGRELLDA